jgi:hypothetical protein
MVVLGRFQIVHWTVGELGEFEVSFIQAPLWTLGKTCNRQGLHLDV